MLIFGLVITNSKLKQITIIDSENNNLCGTYVCQNYPQINLTLKSDEVFIITRENRDIGNMRTIKGNYKIKRDAISFELPPDSQYYLDGLRIAINGTIKNNSIVDSDGITWVKSDAQTKSKNIGLSRLMLSRTDVNGDAAISGLRTLVSVEATWRQTDSDRNGEQDFWTYDVSCFYRMYRSDGETRVEAIDSQFAKADIAYAGPNVFGAGYIYDWSTTVATATAKAGYYFQTMIKDQEGKFYNQNELNGIKATNSSRYGFVAYPATYGVSGVRTFIVNESGKVYSKDLGAGSSVLRWPASDPTTVGWELEE